MQQQAAHASGRRRQERAQQGSTMHRFMCERGASQGAGFAAWLLVHTQKQHNLHTLHSSAQRKRMSVRLPA